MIIELIIALIVGIIAGTFTGLAPGLHINLIAALLLASINKFPGVSPFTLATFIVAMSITHTFLDFIPSIFLGAPEEDTFLSILPGHEMLLEGEGHKAIVFALYGCLAGLALLLIIAPLYIIFLPSIQDSIKTAIPFILIAISGYMIFREKDIFPALVIFSLAGFLGFATFSLPIKEPLLPLLSGLFGLSSLFLSIKNKTKLPEQQTPPLKKITLSKREITKATLASFISAPFCSFLPGIGSSHAATIGSEIIPQNRRGFLFLNGSINFLVMVLSIVAVYSIDKARSGTAAALQELLSPFTLKILLIFLAVSIIVGIISFFWGVFLSKQCIKVFNKIPYQKLTIGIILIVLLLNILLTNTLGILVLFIATALGFYANTSGARRIHSMASLIIPAVLYYLF